MPKLKKVSIEDIAYAANVSKTLVSLVLNNKWEKYGISRETCDKVLGVARELKYALPSNKQPIEFNKGGIIGLIVSDLGNPIYAHVAERLGKIASNHAYRLIVCSSHEDPRKEIHHLQLLKNLGADGVILSSIQKEPNEIEALSDSGFPIVLINKHYPNYHLSAVINDDFQSAKMLTLSLFDKGYDDIAIMAVNPWNISSIHERIEGIMDAHESRGKAFDIENLIPIPYNNIKESIEKALLKRKKSCRLPEAVIALNNSLIVHTLNTLQKIGVKVPSQVALAGFDDLEYNNLLIPSITSVSMPVPGLCQHTFDMLLEKINQKDKHFELKKIPAEIIFRDSTPERSKS